MNAQLQNVGHPLPRYKSHKTVAALKIAKVHKDAHDQVWLTPAEGQGRPYGAFRVSHDYLLRHKPEAGGYYVLYADGYESWSPAKAFDDGYTLITEEPEQHTAIAEAAPEAAAPAPAEEAPQAPTEAIEQ